MRWSWRKRIERADEAVKKAEILRDEAELQERRVEAMTPRVDVVSSSLRQLHTDNHFGPLIDKILRGTE